MLKPSRNKDTAVRLAETSVRSTEGDGRQAPEVPVGYVDADWSADPDPVRGREPYIATYEQGAAPQAPPLHTDASARRSDWCNRCVIQ